MMINSPTSPASSPSASAASVGAMLAAALSVGMITEIGAGTAAFGLVMAGLAPILAT